MSASRASSSMPATPSVHRVLCSSRQSRSMARARRARGFAEDAPPAPATPYAASKLAAEKLIDRWADDVGAIAVHLRLATVYGPRDRGNIAKLEAAIKAGRFFIPWRWEK